MKSPEDHKRRMKELLSRWEQSGLSQKAFAEKEGVPYSTFLYWRQSLRGRQPAKKPKVANRGPLVPVSVIGGVVDSAGFEVQLRNQVKVRVPLGFRAEELKVVLELAGQC